MAFAKGHPETSVKMSIVLSTQQLSRQFSDRDWEAKHCNHSTPVLTEYDTAQKKIKVSHLSYNHPTASNVGA